jgi:hypothetical protein
LVDKAFVALSDNVSKVTFKLACGSEIISLLTIYDSSVFSIYYAILVPIEGFEPSLSGFVDQRFIPLIYTGIE